MPPGDQDVHDRIESLELQLIQQEHRVHALVRNLFKYRAADNEVGSRRRTAALIALVSNLMFSAPVVVGGGGILAAAGVYIAYRQSEKLDQQNSLIGAQNELLARQALIASVTQKRLISTELSSLIRARMLFSQVQQKVNVDVMRAVFAACKHKPRNVDIDTFLQDIPSSGRTEFRRACELAVDHPLHRGPKPYPALPYPEIGAAVGTCSDTGGLDQMIVAEVSQAAADIDDYLDLPPDQQTKEMALKALSTAITNAVEVETDMTRVVQRCDAQIVQIRSDLADMIKYQL